MGGWAFRLNGHGCSRFEVRLCFATPGAAGDDRGISKQPKCTEGSGRHTAAGGTVKVDWKVPAFHHSADLFSFPLI